MLSTDFAGFYHGKLLLTGEYFVLDGVPALAIPTRYGQSFQVESTENPHLLWRALDAAGEPWIEQSFANGNLLQNSEDRVQQRLSQLLDACQKLSQRTDFSMRGLSVTARLDFDRHWGLGTSSTLVAFLADWFGVNPYELLAATFGGSGYDVACAKADGPIVYTRQGARPQVQRMGWRPAWLGHTYFVYLNQKQNSRDGIRAYRSKNVDSTAAERISELTYALLQTGLHLRAAAQILHEHEQIVAQTLGMEAVQGRLFPDFPGQIKSLGAWGGDFIWALSERPAAEIRAYFNGRGYQTVIPYDEMIYQQ